MMTTTETTSSAAGNSSAVSYLVGTPGVVTDPKSGADIAATVIRNHESPPISVKAATDLAIPTMLPAGVVSLVAHTITGDQRWHSIHIGDGPGLFRPIYG